MMTCSASYVHTHLFVFEEIEHKIITLSAALNVIQDTVDEHNCHTIKGYRRNKIKKSLFSPVSSFIAGVNAAGHPELLTLDALLLLLHFQCFSHHGGNICVSSRTHLSWPSLPRVTPYLFTTVSLCFVPETYYIFVIILFHAVLCNSTQ